MNKASISLQLSTSVLSIALFVLLGGGNHDNAPWRGLGVPNFGAIGTYETALRSSIINGRKELGRLMVDDAVASLVPDAVNGDEWQDSIDMYGPSVLPNPDVVIYKDSAFDAAHTMRVIEASGLTNRCQIQKIPFFIASRISYCR